MLKMEIIKFEAQDVITNSAPVPPPVVCDCSDYCQYNNYERRYEHEDCECPLDPEQGRHTKATSYDPEF